MKHYLQILIDLDLAAAREHVRAEHEGSIRPLPNDETLLISMHKARYELAAITASLRTASRVWLQERGYTRMHNLPWPLLASCLMDKGDTVRFYVVVLFCAATLVVGVLERFL